MRDRRLSVDVRPEDVERLERRVERNFRPMRDEAAWLLHWALLHAPDTADEELIAKAS